MDVEVVPQILHHHGLQTAKVRKEQVSLKILMLQTRLLTRESERVSNLKFKVSCILTNSVL